MFKPTGSGDDRCLACKSNHCFICEHRKTVDELALDVSNNNADKDVNPLFLVSNNISSLINDPRCLNCRNKRCFQCEHKFLSNITNQANNQKEHLNPLFFTLSPSNFEESRCLYCINKKCFQCEHKKLFSTTNTSTSTSTNTSLTNTNTVRTKYKINPFYIVSTNIKSQNQCYECRLKKCFQCEHKELVIPLKPKVEPETGREQVKIQQPKSNIGVGNPKKIETNEEKSSKCCFCC